MLGKIHHVIDRHARALLVAGLVGVGVHNWRLWLRDRVLAAHLRAERAQTPTLTRTPKVSALVAAWNEHNHIDAHIRSFLALSYPDIELILCAGGTDDTLERARHYAGERVIVLEQQPGQGKQHALARCLEFASGEIIFLTDADCLYVDEALLWLLATLVNTGEQVATGEIGPLEKQSGKLLPSYLWASDVASSAHHPAYSQGLRGANVAMTRQALDRIGGLNFSARTGTDYHLARRLVNCGIAIRYVGASVVPTEYPELLGVYRQKRSRWLRNLVIYGWQYGARRDVFVTLKTIATGALMLFVPLSAPMVGRNALMLWSLLVAHAVSSKVRYAFFTARLYRWPVPKHLIAGLVPLTLIDFAVWATPLIDLLSAKRRGQW